MTTGAYFVKHAGVAMGEGSKLITEKRARQALEDFKRAGGADNRDVAERWLGQASDKAERSRRFGVLKEYRG